MVCVWLVACGVWVDLCKVIMVPWDCCGRLLIATYLFLYVVIACHVLVDI